MKIILIGCALIVIGIAGFVFWQSQKPDVFGAPLQGMPKMEIARIAEKPEDHLNMDMRVEGKISRQCPVTGCWFYLKDSGGNELRVELGQVAPKLPPRVGRTAIVEGRLLKMADHYELVGNGVEFK